MGKSSLVLRFVREEFYEYQEVSLALFASTCRTIMLYCRYVLCFQSTIGAAFLTHTITLPPSDDQVKFEIWDTAGQERYRSLAQMAFLRLPRTRWVDLLQAMLS